MIHDATDALEARCMWRDRSVGKGFVTYADGHLYIQSETNMVEPSEATSSGYHEKGRFEIPDKGLPSWAHPVVSAGCLYVRNQDALLVYDIKGPWFGELKRNPRGRAPVSDDEVPGAITKMG